MVNKHIKTINLLSHSVQFSSVTQLCLTLCDPMNCSTPGLPVHHKLPEFTQTHAIESVMPSSHLILCCPLLLPPIPPRSRVFSNESTLCMRWPREMQIKTTVKCIFVYASMPKIPKNAKYWWKYGIMDIILYWGWFVYGYNHFWKLMISTKVEYAVNLGYRNSSVGYVGLSRCC